MTEDDFVSLMDAFDALDQAAQRVLVAQPFQMTDAAAKLDADRLKMRSVLQAVARPRTSHGDFKYQLIEPAECPHCPGLKHFPQDCPTPRGREKSRKEMTSIMQGIAKVVNR